MSVVPLYTRSEIYSLEMSRTEALTQVPTQPSLLSLSPSLSLSLSLSLSVAPAPSRKSSFCLTILEATGHFSSKVDGSVPHTKNVNSRIGYEGLRRARRCLFAPAPPYAGGLQGCLAHKKRPPP